MVSSTRNLKQLIYLISPNEIYSDFYKDLEKVLSSKKVSFFQLRLKKKPKKLIINLTLYFFVIFFIFFAIFTIKFLGFCFNLN